MMWARGNSVIVKKMYSFVETIVVIDGFDKKVLKYETQKPCFAISKWYGWDNRWRISLLKY